MPSAENEVIVDADHFSTWAVVDWEIVTDFISGSGNTYHVTVTYDSYAQIPEGAKIKVTVK